MDREEIIVDEQRMYALTKDNANQLYIEVVTGGIAMETIVLRLTEEERKSYSEVGKSFLDDLARDVCRATEKYRKRASE